MAKDGILIRARRGEKPALSRDRRLSDYRAATALAGGLLAAFALATPALAQQGGAGGSGVFGSGGNGGAGGRAISLTVGYSGVVGSNARDHAVRATVGLRF